MANVVVIDRGWNRIVNQLQEANRLEVAVGVQEGSTNSEGASIAEYATYNEFGTASIPSRPFMARAFEEGKDDISADMEREYNAILTGQQSAQGGLLIIGLRHSQRIQNGITRGGWEPNTERTIKRKKSSTPLIDTGAMINSIHPVVRAKALP